MVHVCRNEKISQSEFEDFLDEMKLLERKNVLSNERICDEVKKFVEVYSSSLNDLKTLEDELHRFLSSSNPNLKRVAEEIRRRLRDFLEFCRNFRSKKKIRETFLGPIFKSKIPSEIVEIVRTKQFLHRKKSIVELHKEFFSALSRFVEFRESFPKKSFSENEKTMKNFAQLSIFDSLENFDELRSNFDLNEENLKIFSSRTENATLIEIQNCFNSIFRRGKSTNGKIKKILDEFSRAEKQNQFETIRNKIRRCDQIFDFQFRLQNFRNQNLLEQNVFYEFRTFLHRIFNEQIPLEFFDEFRRIFQSFFYTKSLDQKVFQRFFQKVHKDFQLNLPISLTEEIFQRSIWDEQQISTAIRKDLLEVRFEKILVAF